MSAASNRAISPGISASVDAADGRLLLVVGAIDENGAPSDARGNPDAVEAPFSTGLRLWVAHGNKRPGRSVLIEAPLDEFLDLLEGAFRIALPRK